MFLLKLGIHPWFGDFFFFFPTKWRVTCLSSQIFTLCGYSLRFVSGDLDRSWQFLLLKGTQYQIFYSWINNARPLLAFDYQRAALATFDRRTRANSWIVQTSSAWTVSVLSFRKVTCHSTVQRSSCQDLLKKKTKKTGKGETVVTWWLYFLVVSDSSCARCPGKQCCADVAWAERLWSVFTSAFPATEMRVNHSMTRHCLVLHSLHLLLLP